MRNVACFFGLLAATLAVLFGVRLIDLHFEPNQILSVMIFSMFIYGTLLFSEFRLAFAFGGVALLMALNLLTVQGFTEAANLKVIIFLLGMFLVIGFLEENQFFEQIVARIVARVGPRPKSLLLVLMIMATVSAALVDEVTSILFMTGTMLHLTGKYKLNPIPFIIMLVFATNIGSAASSIGNPIGVMIALNAGFSFVEFLRWSAPIAIVVNIVTYFICRWWFADAFQAFSDTVRAEYEAKQQVSARTAAMGGSGATAVLSGGPGGHDPEVGPLSDDFDSEAATSETNGFDPRQSNVICWVVFIATIGLLCTHGLTERLLGTMVGSVRETVLVVNKFGKDTEFPIHGLPTQPLATGQKVDGPKAEYIGQALLDGSVIKKFELGLGEGTMMIGTALLMGGIVLLLRREKARELVERRVDWWTLSFFMMLFASVGTLEHTGVTGKIADKLIHSTGGNQFLLINIVGWATGWLSAFLDNVLAVATFMPVVHDVRTSWAAQNPQSPGYPQAIYWLMLFGGTFMGNMTLIGSTANIIAVGMLEKRGHGSIKFMEWFKIGLIVSIVGMAIAMVLLGVQTNWFTTPLLPPPTSGIHSEATP